MEKEIVDPVEQLLTQTGCIQLHYKVQECMAEKQDWRQCQEALKEFKSCMQEYVEKKTKNLRN